MKGITNMKYIKCFLRLITWTDKTSGESQSCYAFTTSGASQHSVFGAMVSSSLSIRVAGERVNSSQSDVTLWMNDFTTAEYDLYVEQGNDAAYFSIEGDLDNPKAKLISTAEFNAIDNPSILFARPPA